MNPVAPLRKTFADYAVIAVCPVLIMLLVGSLIFFLLLISYKGSHLGELRWTFFWFVLAMVLVSRIAIERGSDHASLYGLCLAMATGFMLTRYIDFALGAWALLGVIWWAANKLTWDCTLIDDSQDASGEGLLQAARLERRGAGALQKPGAQSVPAVRPLPMAAIGKLTPKLARRSPSRPGAKQPHAPGLWVVYFALGALPLFGLGQGLLAREDLSARQQAFDLLALYVATSLGLLLITSFLGLRRYLRQRRLLMPPAMAFTWLVSGTLLATGVLVACLLLPRPDAYWSVTAMMDRLGDPTSEQRGRSDNNSSAERADASSPSQSQSPGQGRSGPQSGQSSQRGPAARPPGTSQFLRLPHSSLQLMRLLLKLALLGAGVILLLRYRELVARSILEFLRALEKLFSRLLGRRAKAVPPDGTRLKKMSPRGAFAGMRNPFASGAAADMALEELIVRSFRGLEAWAQEHRCGRQPDQTPWEFAEQVALQVPDLNYEARELARLYAQVAYGLPAALPSSRTMLEILWSKMTQSSAGR